MDIIPHINFLTRHPRNRVSTAMETRLILGNSVVGIYSKKLNEKDDAKGWLFGGDAAEAKVITKSM